MPSMNKIYMYYSSVPNRRVGQNKRAGPNKAVQGDFFLKINKRACTSIWHTRVPLYDVFH